MNLAECAEDLCSSVKPKEHKCDLCHDKEWYTLSSKLIILQLLCTFSTLQLSNHYNIQQPMSQRKVLPKKLTVAQLQIQFTFLQNMWVHCNFHHSLTHILSPNSFITPIFCSHIYSSLNNITITAHMFSALQTPC